MRQKRPEDDNNKPKMANTGQQLQTITKNPKTARNGGQ
jgi:hypothetical protein